jgi:hypothetical protein
MLLKDFMAKYDYALAQRIRSAIVTSRYTDHPFMTGWLRAHWVVGTLPDGRPMAGNVVEYGPAVEQRRGFVWQTLIHIGELAEEAVGDTLRHRGTQASWDQIDMTLQQARETITPPGGGA